MSNNNSFANQLQPIIDKKSDLNQLSNLEDLLQESFDKPNDEENPPK